MYFNNIPNVESNIVLNIVKIKATMGTETDDEKSVIRKIFADEGLNGELWIPKVKEHLKLENIILLKHVKRTAFKEFVDQIENPAEWTALMAIFKTIKSRRQYPENGAEKHPATSLLEKERDSAKADRTNILSKATEELEVHKTDGPDGFGTMSNKKEDMQ